MTAERRASQAQEKDRKLLNILNLAASHLADRGVENARLNAELMLCSILEVRRIELYLQFDRVLSPEELAVYREMMRERLRYVPLQYITGETEFMALPFWMDRTVFIPRPETEQLVEAVLQELKGTTEETAIADVGTGCGAIAIALAREIPAARVYAIDSSEDALALAARNAERNDVKDRVILLDGDLLDPLADIGVKGMVRAIVSNPPYIRTEEISRLPEEIREYEPLLALDGGADGLVFYRRLVPEALPFLVDGGWLALEIGTDQTDPVLELIREHGGFDTVRVIRDLNGLNRAILARRSV